MTNFWCFCRTLYMFHSKKELSNRLQLKNKKKKKKANKAELRCIALLSKQDKATFLKKTKNSSGYIIHINAKLLLPN